MCERFPGLMQADRCRYPRFSEMGCIFRERVAVEMVDRETRSSSERNAPRDLSRLLRGRGRE